MNKYLIENRVVFDDHLMMLFDADAAVELTTNETELLSILLQGTVSKQAVIKQIWESKGIIVSEGSYHQLVRALRVKLEAMHIDRNLIKTLPRLGLKFIGAVEQLAEPISIVAPDRNARISELGHDAGTATESLPSDAQSLAPPGATGSSCSTPVMSDAMTGAEESNADLSAAEPCSKALRMPTMGAELIGVSSPQHQWMCLVFCIALAFWACWLTWLTFNHRGKDFEFRFQQTVDSVHYFSNGRMDQRALLQSIGVAPPENSFVYQIGLGPTDWLAVCPKPIQQEAEACESYFFQRSP